MARDYIAALRRHSLEVQDLEGEHAEEFLKLLKGLQEELKSRLLSGDPSQSFDSFAALRFERETQAAIATLEAKAKGQFTIAQRGALDMSFEHMGDELERLSTAFDGSTLDVTLDAAKALADPAQGLLANHFQSSVNRYGSDLLNGVRQRLFVAVRTGDPVSQVASGIAGQQGPMGTVGRANAERLVRTEVSQAYGAAQHSGIVQAAKQVPELRKTWLHAGSYPCDVCGQLDGKQRPIDGTWTVKIGNRTRELVHPPAHPRCVCRLVTMKPAWKSKLQALGYLSNKGDNAPSLAL